GLLLVKKLLVYDPAKALPVSAFALSILPEANPNINCFQALDYFQTGRAHLLPISRTPGVAGGAMGVITLEGASPLSPFPVLPHMLATAPDADGRVVCCVLCADIIEEIISEEIVDETDWYEDNTSKKRAKRMTTAAVMRG
ncbi:hypothetical protein FIBSPDRAFT_722176, partial [Athelia psychrophila]